MCVCVTQRDGGERDRQAQESMEGKRKGRRARGEKVQRLWRRREVREDLEVGGEARTESEGEEMSKTAPEKRRSRRKKSLERSERRKEKERRGKKMEK